MIEILRDGITIRMATNDDCLAVQGLVYCVLAEYDLAPDPEGTDRDLTDIEANYTDRGGLFEVLVDGDGDILGTIGLYPLDADTIELRKMYFARSIRGLGLGRKLLGRTLEKARNMGYLRVYLETARVLKQAVHLYEGFGFTPVDVIHTPRCDQAYILEFGENEGA
ncbi:MAG TPA: GNAT family N-acetyltransferase [Pyrinomonadaceae bacterium]|jgi:putative acetyltransferase